MSCLVSVIVPFFNAAKTLERTLDSIKRQTFFSFEVIMVDDCSTDDSCLIAQQFAEKDNRFQLWCQDKNQGVAAARNKGLDKAKGKYVCFLDADDWWSEDKLELQVDFMQQSQVALSYMSYTRVDENSLSKKNDVIPQSKVTFSDMLKSNHIGNLTAMVLRESIGHIRFEKIGHEDYIFWLDVLRQVKEAKRVPTTASKCFYLVRAGSLSSNKVKMIKWQWHIYREHLKLSSISAVYYLLFYVLYALKKRI